MGPVLAEQDDEWGEARRDTHLFGGSGVRHYADQRGQSRPGR